jgi:hypothetical protein
LAFFDFSSLRTHFLPFTHVLRAIWPAVTRKGAEILGEPRIRLRQAALVLQSRDYGGSRGLGVTGCPDITDKGKSESQKRTKKTKMMFFPR